MNREIRYLILSLSVVISSVMHAPHLDKEVISIHVWRQVQTQSTINNFYEEDFNILNPRKNFREETDGIFRMEFPLMQWLIALLYKVFGPHLFISRLFVLFTGFFTVGSIYFLLNTLFKNPTLSTIGAWTFSFSPSFFYYTINPMPDVFALCFSIYGLAFFFRWIELKTNKNLLLSGLFLCIGTACKLPFILYYSVPLVYFILSLKKNKHNKRYYTQAFTVFGFSVFPILWYAYVIPTWGENPVVKGIFNDFKSIQVAFDNALHHFIATLPELLINYGSVLFFLAGFYFLYKKKAYRNKNYLLLLTLGLTLTLYLLFEAKGIGKIHDYYLFPFFPLIFILVAYGGYHLFTSKSRNVQWLTILLLSILPLTCYLRMVGRWDLNSPGFNKDLLVYKEELRSATPKEDLVIVGNDKSGYIFLYYIDKKGWNFDSDNLSPASVERSIDMGAKYLYTDHNALAQQPEINKFIDSLVLQKGSIYVYKLKA